jgi:hypothetical protein
MTTKPKTRTAPAATATAAPEAPASAPFDSTTNNISKFIARLRFLEADCRYHAAIGDQKARSVALNSRHREERDEIIQRLAKTVPDCFEDAEKLLEFAISRLKAFKAFDFMHEPLIAMLKNAGTGFFKARLKDYLNSSERRFDERLNLLAEEDT